MNPFAAALSRVHARPAGTYATSLFLVLAITMLSAPLWAESDSSSNISLTSLTITPASGSVVFTDPWSSQAFAQAQNSLGGFDQQFNSSNMGQIVAANAMVQFATGHALADPTNLVMNTSNATSTVNIPTIPIGFVAANSQGTADIFNSTFMITGGTGSTNVTFNAMLNSMQSLFTDIHGISATSEVIFTLAINGNVVLFRDSPLMIGSNSSADLPFSGNIGPNSMMLNYNQDYTLFLELDAESSSQSAPEPSTIALLFGGPTLAFGRRWIMAKRT